MCVTRSLMYIRDRVGPRTEPYWTPGVTLHGVEYEPLTTTCCNLLDRNSLIYCNGFPLVPQISTFAQALKCATLLKGVEKTKMPMSTCVLIPVFM